MNKFIVISAMTAMALTAQARNYLSIPYPVAPSDATEDTYFGIKVNDPFRPLENDTAAATLQWVQQENALTNAYLMQIPFRNAVKDRLTQLNDYPKHGLPSRENDGLIYFFENDGLKNQSLLYHVTRLGDTPELFLDPNTLSADGTVALTGVFQSPSGKYTAYTISRSGSDWTEIYVMETASKKLLSDHIEWAKFTGASWIGDDGFIYSAYARPESGKEFSNANEFHKIYYHKIGTPQSKDRVEYENKSQPLYFHQGDVSDDGSAMFIMEAGQGLGNSLMVKALKTPGAKIQVMEASQDYEISPIDVIDGKIYFFTTKGAPLGKIMMAPLDDAANTKKWKTIVPEQKNVMKSATMASDKLLVTFDVDAANMVDVYTLKGKKIGAIDLPTYGTVVISSSKKHDDVFYAFSSFTYPSTQYTFDLSTMKSTLFRDTEIKGFNPSDYVTEQVFYPSADGTKIPMFITYKKGLKRDGNNPVYLYGYGGFNITLNPGFSAYRVLWLENGGIYAQANLRGGNEYGEAWHKGGTKMEKLNVFNDFISAAEYMIAEGWSSKDLMTIEGGSNGGLLVGACVNMRPDLFKVAIPRVGVMDMMRYHLFTIGWNWASDYGTSADSKEMAQYLRNYSPAHNISDNGTPYPAIMVTTADHDDRVVPAHSFKYAAALQAADTGDAPKIIRIDSKAGHGAGKPVSKVIDEYTDIYSFIFYNLGITPCIR